MGLPRVYVRLTYLELQGYLCIIIIILAAASTGKIYAFRAMYLRLNICLLMSFYMNKVTQMYIIRTQPSINIILIFIHYCKNVPPGSLDKLSPFPLFPVSFLPHTQVIHDDSHLLNTFFQLNPTQQHHQDTCSQLNPTLQATTSTKLPWIR
jgi:hypothetical protein